jgi:hypothetical protein
MGNIAKGAWSGVSNIADSKVLLDTVQAPLSDAIAKIAVPLGWDTHLVDSLNGVIESSKALNFHHQVFRMEVAPAAAIEDNPNGKWWAFVEQIDVPIDRLKPLYADWDKILANRSLISAFDQALAPKKLDWKLTPLAASVLPEGAVGSSLKIVNPAPETCKPGATSHPLPCAFEIDYALVPDGKNTLEYLSFNDGPEEIKPVIARSRAKSQADSVTSIVAPDTPGVQVALPSEYLYRSVGLAPEGPQGVMLEGLSDVGIGPDLSLRFAISVDKAFAFAFAKIMALKASHGAQPVPNGHRAPGATKI